MNFKIDTKEKFTVITPLELTINDNMTISLKDCCNTILENKIKNVVINLQNVDTITIDIAKTFVELQELFYSIHASFVLCCLSKNIQNVFEKEDLFDIINYTPTESEAWDIVQIDEIERELFGDDNTEM